MKAVLSPCGQGVLICSEAVDPGAVVPLLQHRHQVPPGLGDAELNEPLFQGFGALPVGQLQGVPGLDVYKRQLQVGHHHRARRGLPDFQGRPGEEVRQGGCLLYTSCYSY